jgi:hypothetical protein
VDTLLSVDTARPNVTPMCIRVGLSTQTVSWTEYKPTGTYDVGTSVVPFPRAEAESERDISSTMEVWAVSDSICAKSGLEHDNN